MLPIRYKRLAQKLYKLKSRMTQLPGSGQADALSKVEITPAKIEARVLEAQEHPLGAPLA